MLVVAMSCLSCWIARFAQKIVNYHLRKQNRKLVTMRKYVWESTYVITTLCVWRVENGFAAIALTCFFWMLLSMALLDAYVLKVSCHQLGLFALFAIVFACIKSDVLALDRIVGMFLFSLPVAFLMGFKKQAIGSGDLCYLMIAGYGFGIWGIVCSCAFAYGLASLYGLYRYFVKQVKERAIAMFPFFFIGCFLYVLLAYEFVRISLR